MGLTVSWLRPRVLIDMNTLPRLLCAIAITIDLAIIRVYQQCALLRFVSERVENENSAVWLDIESTLLKCTFLKLISDNYANPMTVNAITDKLPHFPQYLTIL